MALCDGCGIDATGGVPELAVGLHQFVTGQASGTAAFGGWNVQISANTNPSPTGYIPGTVTDGVMTLALDQVCTDRVRQVEVEFWGQHAVFTETGAGNGFTGTAPLFRFVPAWQVNGPYGSGLMQTMNVDMNAGVSQMQPLPGGGAVGGVTHPLQYYQSFVLTIPAGATAPLTVRFRPVWNVSATSPRRYRFFSARPMFGQMTLYHV